MTTRRGFALPALLLIYACAAPQPHPTVPVRVVGTDTIPIPISEMGPRTYKGLSGGLYPGGLNLEPSDHDAVGIVRRNAVRPLSVNGIPTGAGRYVLMSVGGTNASAAWCSASSAPPCNSWSFSGRSVSDPSVNHSALVIVNGAFPRANVAGWSSAASPNYDRIRDTRLAPLGLSEKQVQAIWMPFADTGAVFPVTASAASASARLQRIGATIRTLKQRYPNLQLLFISSAAYGGYSISGEPSRYESGFVVRWTLESQISQLRGQSPNVDVGDLSGTAAPWISWGPYLWTRGSDARADGFFWAPADNDSAGTGLSRAGEAKVGGALFEFFKASSYTRCWFLAGPVCG